ncbi:RelA/SpoT domain-containing protein [Leifsonia sp. 1010]|uniref:GTP pyrophosphokinase n=1 Tax=Leifsonia sp. 1010 TaxID=2817769 RepID=UPI002862DBE2|nr:RelA/SpoT domain-containing protein [Leifsonia sp. 1010]MDR6612338.1 putative GTP pyrophosphokinase [Leifsonia sp. 1010]
MPHQLTHQLVENLYAARHRQWNSARTSVENFLSDLCHELLEGEDPYRLKVTGRIKDAQRAFEKAQRKLPSGMELASMDDVTDVVKDIVGVKLLCKTLRDSDLAVEAITARCTAPGSVIRFHNPDENEDYVATPKPSGYRARHLLLELDVAGRDSRIVVVEVQVKTMLQDAWGELTHEDLYKSGPLVPSSHHGDLARTMAGLLWEVDQLADIIARQTDSRMQPTLEETQPGATADANDRIVEVTHTGARYALATDDQGRRGLIPAVVIRDLVAPRRHINVDDYVSVGQRLTVQAVDTGDGYYFHPLKPDELSS